MPRYWDNVTTWQLRKAETGILSWFKATKIILLLWQLRQKLNVEWFKRSELRDFRPNFFINQSNEGLLTNRWKWIRFWFRGVRIVMKLRRVHETAESDSAMWLTNVESNSAVWLTNVESNSAVWLTNVESNSAVGLTNVESNSAVWLTNVESNSAVWLTNVESNSAVGLTNVESNFAVCLKPRSRTSCSDWQMWSQTQRKLCRSLIAMKGTGEILLWLKKSAYLKLYGCQYNLAFIKMHMRKM